MTLTNCQIEEIIQTLQGTCMTLDDGIQEILGDDKDSDSLSEYDLNLIELEIFKCEQCGWWYETCEKSEDDENCEDCYEVINDDD